MSGPVSTRPVMSTPLRVFIAISIVLHVALVGAIVIPSILGLFRPRETPPSEEQILLMKQRAAEEMNREAARAAVKEELARALKEDMRRLAAETPAAAFESAWSNSLSVIESNLNATAARLAQEDLADLSPRELAEALSTLREAELDVLTRQLSDRSKDDIANRVLNEVAGALPGFTRKALDLMEQAESPKLRSEVDALLAREQARRQRELAAAGTALNGAEREVRRTAEQSAAIGKSLAGILGDSEKRSEAARKADESLEKALRAAGEARRGVEAMEKALADKADADRASTNGAASPAAASSARDRTAGAASQADLAAMQGAVRAALDGAARELRGTAAGLRDKAEKAVADILGEAARHTETVGAGPMKQVADVAAGNNAKARAGLPAVQAALSNLTAELSRQRGVLEALAGRPSAGESGEAAAARARMDEVARGLGEIGAQLDKAAGAADKGGDRASAQGIDAAARSARETRESALARAADALTPKPANPAIPDSAPRPGRKEIAAARRDIDTVTNRLDDLSQAIAGQKAYVSGAASRFESNVARTVTAALTEDPDLRQQSRDFIRETVREQVAGEFRQKTETLAAQVLAAKGLAPDEAFVRRVGEAAADLLMAGTETNLLNAAFPGMMAQTAKRFGVKPEAMQAADLQEEPGDEAVDAGEKDGTHAEGSRKSRKKSRNARPASAPSPEAGGDEDNGMEEVAQALTGTLSKGMQSGARGAIAQSAKTALRLPGVDTFGASAADALRQRLADARGGALRSLSTGGREALAAGISDNLVEVGLKLRQGATSGRRTGLYNNPEEYRRNLETVIKGREVKEELLVAPSLTNALAAASTEVASNRPAMILVGSGRSRQPATPTNAAPAEPRLAPPEFNAFAYGGAPFATNPPVIDGDLSDWGAVRPFALRGILEKNWVKDIPPAWETNRYLMVQWDYTGFYFAYRMVDQADDTNIRPDNFWEGDSLELWFDFSNRRTDSRAEDQQQFWFWPLGARNLPGVIGGEVIMPGMRMEARFKAGGLSPTEPRMAVRRIPAPRGYQVEVYVPRACFRRPDLTPGRIMAFNFSINNGDGVYLLWTTNLGKQNSMTPSLWGDLVLLGSDARIATVKPHRGNEPLPAIMPGEPLGVRVTDPDMNLDPGARNRIKVRFETAERQALVGLLEETGPDSGVFDGSIDTIETLTDDELDATSKALPVVSGSYVEIAYYDQARRYGERNYTVRRRLPVGVPVVRMTSRR